MEKTYALIMAGGVGTRFWPKSRKSLPKQYLNLLGRETLIQAVCNRLQVIVPTDRIYVVSTKNQVPLIKAQLPWLQSSHLILEPFGKNTAPCIGLAALHLVQRDPEAVMMILPSDHLVSDTDKFAQVLQDAVGLVRKNPEALATIGIEPAYPATGYGYIQRGAQLDLPSGRAFRVRAFAEKPTAEVAEQFISTGEFLWNSGMFIWRAANILHYIEDLMPDLSAGLKEIEKAIGTAKEAQVTERVYKQIHSDSIDYGIMEHASNVMVLEGNFGWSDVGSWEEVYKISAHNEEGNVVVGDPIIKNCRNCYIEAGGRVVAAIGLEDLIIVDTPDALLICRQDQSQEVKWVVEKLKHSGQQKVL
jgi:mannose-1-phosphate guanylyltransferase